uniref:Uncharacterized protein n=1 Tax=Panagrolaimus sp. ES5 TaxID=591445 RepID=A0AC34FQZ4_9BILA
MREKSEKFQNIVKKLCPGLDIRKIQYGINDYVQFISSNGDFLYGKILLSNNELFTTEIIKGVNLLDYGDNDLTLPGDIRFGFFLFKQHISFGIKVTGTGDTIVVDRNKILFHCCMFSDNINSYVFSLDCRMAGK